MILSTSALSSSSFLTQLFPLSLHFWLHFSTIDENLDLTASCPNSEVTCAINGIRNKS